ncbi:hypothetical protein UC8_36080 [Roseimaritima ulvae]|uniref:Uncharacterized protein n=1 Tax=Roseimaritima ulvae TaxID=980254 RepID=A0A5B9R5S4_9BACT|nr:hypothetical protein UC8_36080 [Roseimaritima ulvae]
MPVAEVARLWSLSPSLWEGREERAGRVRWTRRSLGRSPLPKNPPLADARPSQGEGEVLPSQAPISGEIGYAQAKAAQTVSAAAMVCSISASVCVRLKNMASNWLQGR